MNDYKEVKGTDIKGRLCTYKVKVPVKHYGRMIVYEENKCNKMRSIIICPHCGRLTDYGWTAMHCGVHGCQFCINELSTTIELDREYNYEAYAKKANNFEYEPYRYKED